MFGFGGKDWNVVAIIFERPDLYKVNGQRAKGKEADSVRDAVKKHPRTIFWAAFDQKGGFVEGEAGPGSKSVTPQTLQQLIREAPANPTVREVLGVLEKGTSKNLSKAMVWGGYPVKVEPKKE